MTHALTAACLWALAATLTAFLPFRRQMVPGIALLAAAPVILIWIGAEHGPWLALAATLGFLSMFRNPLIHLWRRATGRAAPPSPEPEHRE
ncbi:MAG: DUF2484 family protein [Paracoccaceae bacterium]|nr:MAG: DUF2484 family protein [Paracoccaceae bacterium]